MEPEPENQEREKSELPTGITGASPTGANTASAKKAMRSRQDMITMLARILVACITIIWGAMNLAKNIPQFRFDGAGLVQVLLQIGLIAMVGLLPVLVGIWMLTYFDRGLKSSSGNEPKESKRR